MKTCTSCKHHRVARALLIIPLGVRYNTCVAPKAGLNPVDGKPKEAFADFRRDHYGACGPTGTLWEQK